MGIVLRFKRLISADLHSILDSIEEPQEVLKQSVREMEEALHERDKTQALLAQRQKTLSDVLDRYSEEMQELDRQLQLCLANSNDELAKAVLRRTLTRRKECRDISAEVQSLQERKAELQRRCADDRKRLEGLKEKLGVFKFDAPQDDSVPTLRAAGAGVSDEEIELALLQAKQEHAKASAGIEAKL